MTRTVPVLILILCVAMAAGAAQRTKKAAAKPAPLPDPHHHTRLDRLPDDDFGDFAMTEAQVPGDAEPENVTENPDGTVRAFTIANAEGIERIFVEVGGGPTYELENIPFPYRPASDFTWADANVLVFDRSTNPQLGAHYAVDVKARKLVGAAVFGYE